jgi:hypothetical protein
MSKKSRSYKNKRRRPNVTKLQQDSLSPSPIQASVDKRQLTYNNISHIQSQSNHYQYLMPELRRIGILAGAIVLILIILSFILG